MTKAELLEVDKNFKNLFHDIKEKHKNENIFMHM